MGSLFISPDEVYRGYIVFAFSVMFVCLSVCLSVNIFFSQRFYTPGTKYIGGI